MEAVKQELLNRKTEMENYMRFLEIMEDGSLENHFTNLNYDSVENERFIINRNKLYTTMKASVILMLYTVIESTITTCLKKIHAEIRNNNLFFGNLNEGIQKIILLYYLSIFDKKENMKSEIDSFMNFIHTLQQNKMVFLSYDDICKYYQLYSGNLDTKEIRSVLKKYEIEFDEHISELTDIKNKRNKLAHGINSFETIGRGLSIQRIQILKEKVFLCMDKVIESVEKYLINKRYLNSNNSTNSQL